MSKTLKRSAFLVVPALLVIALAWSLWGRPSRVIAGGAAPAMVGTGLDGERIDLESYRGQPVVINFWASWCIPCQQEAPDLAEIRRAYMGRDLVILGVNSEDLQADARRFVTQHDLDYPHIRDTDGAIKSRWGVRAFPETFFLDRDLTVVEHYFGPLSESDMRIRIERLL